jgi:hypothetical protein
LIAAQALRSVLLPADRTIPEPAVGGSGISLKLSTFVVGVIGSSPEASRGNFQAPPLVSCERMAGKQIILIDPELSVRRPLL